MTAFSWRSLALASLAAGTALLCRLSPEVGGGGEAGVVMELPAMLRDFVSEPRDPDPVETRLLPADTRFAKAVYRTRAADAASRDVIHCELVLSGAERRSIHRPEVCLQGQGWTLLESSTRTLPVSGGHELRVRDLYIRKDITLKDGTRRPLRAHYFYWFVGQDVATPSHAERLWLTLRDNITRGVNHRWAYATALALVTDNFSPPEIGERPRGSEATIALLGNFIHDLAPRFQKSFMDNPPVTAAN
jgi:hypothetical protein